MKYFLLCTFLFFNLILNAQKVTPQVISSSGVIVESDAIKVSWTLGEFSVATIGDNPKLTQGFQQSKLQMGTGIVSPEFKTEIKVFPNPTYDRIRISVQDDINIKSLELMDGNGKVIRKKKFIEQTELSMAQLPESIYFIRIAIDRKIIYTTSIIKI